MQPSSAACSWTCNRSFSCLSPISSSAKRHKKRSPMPGGGGQAEHRGVWPAQPSGCPCGTQHHVHTALLHRVSERQP